MTDDNRSSLRRKIGNPPSTDTLGHNKDLLLQFLIYLPAKPLLRFKAVSKTWLSIIADPKFRTDHAAHHHNPIPSALLLNPTFSPPPTFHLLRLNPDDPPFRLPAIDYLPAPLVKIWHSCNGLLLCSSTHDAAINGQDSRDLGLRWEYERFPITGDSPIRYHICNPTTKESKTIACPSLNIHALNLAFNPAISPHYRVICISGLVLESMYEILVYSSETDSWQSICSFMSGNTVYFRFPVFFNGAIYWDSDGDTSFYYKVDNASLEQMPMPAPTLLFETRYFGESRGHLHKIKVAHCPDLTFDIYEMRDDHSDWDVKYQVCLSSILFQLWQWGVAFNMSGNCNAFSVFDLIREDNEDDSRLVILVSGRVIAFKLNKLTCKDLGNLDLLPNQRSLATLYFSGFSAYRYIDTLACI